MARKDWNSADSDFAGRWPRMALVGLSASAVVAAGSPPPVALAQPAPFHQYTVAFETNTSYQGVHSVYGEQIIGGIPSTGCSLEFTGNPIYQTNWVIFDEQATNWVELGSGHQCNNQFRYDFAGYGYNGDWFPLYVQRRTTWEVREYTIWSNDQAPPPARQDWHWWIGGQEVRTYPVTPQTPWAGTYASVGVESYAQFAQVPRHNYASLSYKEAINAEDVWVDWKDRDALHIDPAMSGGWNSDTSFWASQP
jgi:hypothetical protein